ncbi:MAG: MazG family protein [Coriobacteriia bacterium]|nr:MazG family protein [Coriobacteriia bacterium]
MCTADEEAARSFESFVAMIERLRAPDGCPWDRVQTHASIAGNMVEEAYEAVGAIEENNVAGLAEELGDVLLQVVLQSQIASENGEFDIGDVIAGISDKIVRRHPHVFGDTAGAGASAGAGAATAGAGAATPTEVHRRWDEIKRAEKASAGKGALDEVPFSLPALTLSQVISRKAVAAGFEWEALSGVWDKLDEELAELKATEPGSE